MTPERDPLRPLTWGEALAGAGCLGLVVAFWGLAISLIAWAW